LALENEKAFLRPLTPADLEELHRALDEESAWRYLPTSQPKSPSQWAIGWEHTGTQEIGTLLGADATWLIRGASDGAILGMTSFLDVQAAHRGLEIGSTVLARSARGTGLNAAAKHLLLGYAFEVLGAIRVCFKTDARNLASQRALEKLGAKKEGVLRSHRLMPDGYRRDSVYYSVLDHEWPDLRDRR
jgi:RimJ/RimL family protein N-acetyltransferase